MRIVPTVRPTQLDPKPGLLVTLIGGAVASLLLLSLLNLAPTVGLPFIDLPHLLGGLVAASPSTAFWIGAAAFLGGGTFLLGPALVVAWPLLPSLGAGSGNGLLPALVKGSLWGGVVWGMSGVLLPLLALGSRLDATVVGSPGLFALSFGVGGAVVLLVTHLVFGLAVALFATIARGISPLDAMGWPGYIKADTPPGSVLDRSPLPQFPPVGMR